MKECILLILVMMGTCSLWAQSPPQIKPLTIGDTVPDIVFNHILNYKDTTARLSDFKGKPVILDFFATWCGSCIGSLPKLDSLQKQFRDSIRILVVGYEPESKVSAFLQNNPIGKKIAVPFVTGDSILNKLFPHRLIPHEVWIDQQGKVTGITQADYVTGKNIQQLLAGRFPKLPLKKDLMDFDRNSALRNRNGGDKDILFKALITKHLDGVGSMAGISYSYDSSYKRVYYINFSLMALYLAAIHYSIYTNRIVLNVRDSSIFINNKNMYLSEWVKGHTYCYELTIPSEIDDDSIRNIMQEDLNRCFRLYGRKETRTVPGWALIRTDHKDSLFHTKGGKPIADYEARSPVKIFRNQPVSKLADALNSQVPGRPLVPLIFDETGFTGNIDVALRVDDIHDIPGLRNALQKYGLDLVPVRREVEVLVLTDDPAGKSNLHKNTDDGSISTDERMQSYHALSESKLKGTPAAKTGNNFRRL